MPGCWSFDHILGVCLFSYDFMLMCKNNVKVNSSLLRGITLVVSYLTLLREARNLDNNPRLVILSPFTH